MVQADWDSNSHDGETLSGGKYHSRDRNMPAKKTIFQKISDDAVQARTDKVWRAWFRILDKFGMEKKGHAQAAKYLRDKHGLSAWWAQAVTIRYEWERGLRGNSYQ